MNNRERTRLRTICKNQSFKNFYLNEWLTSFKVPGAKKKHRKKYIKMVLNSYRKWYESITKIE